jgi:alkanesulfonate monooxygenase SsuD/methylene tetrahydromethanopterin reductase-like flavin-dependent oxidoreductase (luciferase family)
LPICISQQGGDAGDAYQSAAAVDGSQLRMGCCAYSWSVRDRSEAERLAASAHLRRLNTDYGINAPVPTPEEAAAYAYTEADRRRIDQHKRRVVLGTPEEVRQRLLALAGTYQADELMLITVIGDYERRLRSYELVAQSFGLCQRSQSSAR